MARFLSARKVDDKGFSCTARQLVLPVIAGYSFLRLCQNGIALFSMQCNHETGKKRGGSCVLYMVDRAAEDQVDDDMRLTFCGEVCIWEEMTTGKGGTLTLPYVRVDCAHWLIIRE